MVKVTAAEFQKHFGRYKDAAQREPVIVTSHGRESLVVLSVEDYRRLEALDTRRAYHPAELPDDLKDALDVAEAPAWTARFDPEVNG
jgi:prevent-host-death family protein